MTRGKHAVQASRRREDAAMTHLDRMSDQLAEAKITARRYKSAAERVPGLEQEIRRLRVLIDEGTSDRLEELESIITDLVLDREETERHLKKVDDLWARVLMRISNIFSPANAGSAELQETMLDLLGPPTKVGITVTPLNRNLPPSVARKIDFARGNRSSSRRQPNTFAEASIADLVEEVSEAVEDRLPDLMASAKARGRSPSGWQVGHLAPEACQGELS